MSNNSVVIVAAKRLATGKFCGSLSSLSVADLSAHLIKECLSVTKVQSDDIREVILGHVLNAGAKQNPARQASIAAGLPHSVTAFSINQVCGSGLRSIMLASDIISKAMSDSVDQDSKIILAGGHESMSNTPFLLNERTQTLSMGDKRLIDMMVHDGLTDAFSNVHMGITAENIAKKYNISREAQDEFALESSKKAEYADSKGFFIDEIVPINIVRNKETILFSKDETIRYGTKIENLSKLKPAFDKSGTVTAGNASTLNDGAAIVMLMPENEARDRRLPIMAKIVAYAQAGNDPQYMGLAPVYAVRKAMAKAGWQMNQLDCIEANEAFAAQAIAVGSELGWNMHNVNISGGAIALGHPIGASGARILVTLIHNLIRRGGGKGLATLCIGGGMAVAMCIEV